jgi:cytochrome c biogenesis protein CcdA
MTQISHTAPTGTASHAAPTAPSADAAATGTVGASDAVDRAESVSAVKAEPISVLDKVGMGILGLLTLSGLWMMLAPFLTDTQKRGADWTAGTTNDFFVGLVLAVISLAALVAVLAGGLSAVARRARARAAHQEA